jgi:hypothetical protein
LLPENCAAALEALGVQPAAPAPANPAPAIPDCVIVGTGHRVDAKDRQSPRFPNTAECIGKVKDWLRERIAAEKAATAGTAGSTTGIAGAASGFDLLFHEVCGELGVPTTVVLPIPKVDYQLQSVSDGGRSLSKAYRREAADHSERQRKLADLGGVDRQLRRVPARQHTDDQRRLVPGQRQRGVAGAMERQGGRRTGRHSRHD